MGYIHCCGGLRKTKSYKIVPQKNYLVCELEYLIRCPVCGHTAVQLTRIDTSEKLTVVRKINNKALKFFSRLKKYILYEKSSCKYAGHLYQRFYLNYNEYGVKKRCYSNLSTVKLGLFDNEKLTFKYNSYPIKTV